MRSRPDVLRLWLLAAAIAAYVPLTSSGVAAVSIRQASAAPPASTACAEMEDFLKTAKIGPQRQLSVGVTAPHRATLTSGALQHDASIQVADVSKMTFETLRGNELNFRDSWKFNVAGYELAKLLSLNMVPPYVQRHVSGQDASLSWWVNDTMMERERYKRKLEPPDVGRWNHEMYAVRVFHQLIYDTDPNMTNLLITRDWHIWMIDFTRAFRLVKDLRDRKDLVKCDRRLLGSLKQLTAELLQQKLGEWLTKPEIDGVIARRDRIVEFFDREVAKKGEAAVLYDLPRTAEACGTGLR